MNKCKGKCHATTFPYFRYACNNNEWKDGYCKIHHPGLKLEKLKKRNAIKDALINKAEEVGFLAAPHLGTAVDQELGIYKTKISNQAHQ